MKTKEEKLETLKAFLKENNIAFEENYHSESFDVTMALRVSNLRIAVFLSTDDKDKDTMLTRKMNQNNLRLHWIYTPFFIRDSETEEFTLEKMQNCVFDKMVKMQKQWQKKQNKKQ